MVISFKGITVHKFLKDLREKVPLDVIEKLSHDNRGQNVKDKEEKNEKSST